MASPKPQPRSEFQPQPPRGSGKASQQTPPNSNNPSEAVHPIWLLKAIAFTFAAALVCGYITLCLLFYQGQWQFVLHPARGTHAPTSIAGAPFQTIHFGVDETASPQLVGWFIAAEPPARYTEYTVLYLPSGDGSLGDSIPTLAALHDTGLNVFAFDYRGYGESAATRPNQRGMTEDAASAWRYLTVSRTLPASHIILYGNGVGCALAAGLAASHREAPAVVLESPRPDLVRTVLADPRTKSLPVRALFREDFEITRAVSNLKTPKLFLLNLEAQSPVAMAGEIQQLTSRAAIPKIVSTLQPGDFNGPLYREQIARFLDQYVR